ncbi:MULTISPECIES: hypothetical protein [Shewanella]|uniref:hypothetical protein n=1 Tax=Shewanella TaxID=22 RepID=UPI001559E23E|nr:hypothetical protein [Shewanella xiamenensis]
MWRGDKLKTSRIVKYTLIMFVLLTALSTFTSTVIGVENLAALSFGEYFTYQLLPSSILAISIYALMAKLDSVKAWSYATIVFIFNFILEWLILSLLMQELYIPPTWFIELPLSVLSAITGTLIGGNWGQKRAAAT